MKAADANNKIVLTDLVENWLSIDIVDRHEY